MAFERARLQRPRRTVLSPSRLSLLSRHFSLTFRLDQLEPLVRLSQSVPDRFGNIVPGPYTPDRHQ